VSKITTDNTSASDAVILPNTFIALLTVSTDFTVNGKHSNYVNVFCFYATQMTAMYHLRP